jgi:hypothetical protein
MKENPAGKREERKSIRRKLYATRINRSKTDPDKLKESR